MAECGSTLKQARQNNIILNDLVSSNEVALSYFNFLFIIFSYIWLLNEILTLVHIFVVI